MNLFQSISLFLGSIAFLFINLSGCSEFGTVEDNKAPSIYEKTITVSDITTSSVRLNWTPARDKVSSSVKLNYAVYRSLMNNIGTVSEIVTNGIRMGNWNKNISTLTVDGLKDSSSHYFNVIVEDEEGNRSVYTPVLVSLQDSTAPLVQDKNLVLSAQTSDSITISWNQAQENVFPAKQLSYRLYYSTSNNIATLEQVLEHGIPVEEWEASLATRKVSGLTASRLYYFNVIVRDEAGNQTAYNMLETGTAISSSWVFRDSDNGINKSYSENAGRVKASALGTTMYAVWQESDGNASQIRVAEWQGDYLWSFIDGNGSTGINKSTSKNAYNPQLAVIGTKLYATWQESNGTNAQIRVAQWSSNAWSFIDGNGTNGINKDTGKNATNPVLTVLGTTLYVAWQESDGTADQIRVAQWDGNSTWTFIDGNASTGRNKDTSRGAGHPHMAVLSTDLYVIWEETDGTAKQIRVAKWNGLVWSFIDGNGTTGLNHDTSRNASNPDMIVYDSKLLATWQEGNGTSEQIRVAQWDGTNWSFKDGGGTAGINNNQNRNAEMPQLTIFQSKVYLTWQETDGAAVQVRVAKWGGNSSWSFVDGNKSTGINKSTVKNAGSPYLSVMGSKLYALWQENNGTADQIRVAQWDESSTWTIGEYGLNKAQDKSAETPHMVVLDSKLYGVWKENNGTANQVRVARWDGGTSWTYIDGNSANGLNFDSGKQTTACRLAVVEEKLYAVWQEYNGTAEQVRVAQWDGSSKWTFVDGNSKSGINKASDQSASNPYPTVLNAKLYVTWQEGNGNAEQVRIARWDGDASWSFIDGNNSTGINYRTDKNGTSPKILAFQANLLAVWLESDGTADQVRVAKWNGVDTWEFVDGEKEQGINKFTSLFAVTPHLAVFNSKVYAIWGEGVTQQVRVAQWDGDSIWTFVDGDGVNGINKSSASIANNPLLMPYHGSLYAAWSEYDTGKTPKKQIRIAFWNGTSTWSFMDGNDTYGINKATDKNASTPDLQILNSKFYAIWSEHKNINTGQIHVIEAQ
ncbi:MAG: fibronectin type III domain-containing protein [SAR324 cluster bacterium]|nr:fibronectin type III domain-containing protein [SAR324 cluster bacterium]